MPNPRRNELATEPSATRAAVSRALARSRTGRASSKPYFCIPVKSACPGRGRVSFSPRAPSSGALIGSADMTCCHFGHSLFCTVMATGPPIVNPCLTPPDRETTSFSSFILAPLPKPSRRRASASWTSAVVISTPAGSPSRIATSSGPWDSPAVSQRSIRVYPSAWAAARIASASLSSFSTGSATLPFKNTLICAMACQISISIPLTTLHPLFSHCVASALGHGL